MESTSLADQEINKLFALHPKGFDLSLTRILRLLQQFDNPHLKLPPTLHISGTNGKGSATAFCRALLEAADLRVHVHTSPHLVNWHERYRLGAKGGGQFVSDAELAQTIREVAQVNSQAPITVFEILTVVAFILFARHAADAVILEVGLGGRFDATNVIPTSAASLIMPIALDHQAFLGETIEKIAFEKAGIIKPHCPVIIGHQQDPAAIDVITHQAGRLKAPTTIYGQDYLAYTEHGRMVFQHQAGLMDLPLPALPGLHQIDNAAAAIEAVLQAGFTLSEAQIAQAMKNVNWPARMQRLDHGKLIDLLPPLTEVWLDGGHNPAAGQVIAAQLQRLQADNPKPLYMICGMINTKDPYGYFEAFQSMPEQVYCVPIDSSDAGIEPATLVEAASKAGLSAQAMPDIEQALNQIKQQSVTQSPRILIGGSLYLAGDVLKRNATPPV